MINASLRTGYYKVPGVELDAYAREMHTSDIMTLIWRKNNHD